MYTIYAFIFHNFVYISWNCLESSVLKRNSIQSTQKYKYDFAIKTKAENIPELNWQRFYYILRQTHANKKNVYHRNSIISCWDHLFHFFFKKWKTHFIRMRLNHFNFVFLLSSSNNVCYANVNNGRKKSNIVIIKYIQCIKLLNIHASNRKNHYADNTGIEK